MLSLCPHNAFGYQRAVMKRFDKAIEARRRARSEAQKPGAVRVIPDKRQRPAKHRKPLHEAMADATGHP